MNKLKEAQISFIVDEATKLFFTRPIEEVTISDIAKEIEIGEASLYRYFGKKSNLVLLAAEKLSKEVFNKYFIIDESKNGFSRLEDFFNSYLNIFINNKNYYYFINSFDAYIVKEKSVDLTQYNNLVNSFKTIFDSAYEAGIKDKSIKYDGDKDIYYRSTTLSLLNLCKKLAVEDNLLEEDKKYEAANEIKALIEIFLYRIK